MATTYKDCNKDVKLIDPPQDTVSCLNFSKTANFLSVSSWDKSVRIYEIKNDGSSVGKAIYHHDAPVLSTCFSPVSLISIVSVYLFHLRMVLKWLLVEVTVLVKYMMLRRVLRNQ
ncbi:RNA export factor gle2 [Entomophthora muscae]|uniref:RNA export factor gle2 n=1 Tax=Entomophthora muscae TaxID=34485 RepID=A0ACC2S643_9FUNG|nr:RNA export factor gle2 [Entomophthora muscae]